ncbi:Mobile element protein [Geitlerinema sp. FC II]|nr:Mobile element protein [Geitlerinema sp. FC II]
MGHTVTVCGASVRRSLRSSRSLHPRERRLERHCSGEQLRKPRKGQKQKSQIVRFGITAPLGR